VPSFSAGLAVYGGAESVQTFIDRADKALYRAKQAGRDRIIVDEKYLPDSESDTSDHDSRENN
jgi:predicted signal transduction protein with EAL and GGDEF domain